MNMNMNEYHELDNQISLEDENGLSDSATAASRLSEELDNPLKEIRATRTEEFRVEDLIRSDRRPSKEHMLFFKLDQAFDSGDLNDMQKALGALSEQPNSIASVMKKLKESIEKKGLEGVSWETGTYHDTSNHSFVRLHITPPAHHNSLGGFSLTIGSDGKHSASYRAPWSSGPARSEDPSAVLRDMTRTSYSSFREMTRSRKQS